MMAMTGKEKPPAAKAHPVEAPEGERIAKVLSRAGVASRREAERLIELGEVKVNGKVIASPALNVTASDRITVRGEPVGQPEPPRLWLYYKPEGLVTSAADEKGRDTVFDHLPEDMPRVMSVGRLDLNSEGLLLLTNDGELKRRLELPSTGWLRKYRVRVKGNPTDPDLEPLRKGVVVDGERFQPMDVKLDRHQGANAWLTVGLREGRNREIRRAMSHIGLTVNRLIRISYGPFRLNELKPGEVEEVKPRVLRDQLGLAEAPEAVRVPPRMAAKPPGKAAPGAGVQAKSKPGVRKPFKAGQGPGQGSEARPRASLAPAKAASARPGKNRPIREPQGNGPPQTSRTARPGKPPVRPGPGPAKPGKR
jgi:23S rRNA pseudouridine2605 synthase